VRWFPKLLPPRGKNRVRALAACPVRLRQLPGLELCYVDRILKGNKLGHAHSFSD
jgi:hypothetical protein